MAKNVLVDTGFWFAFYTPGDSNHEKAFVIADLLTNQNVLVPWPTLYETVNSKFLKRREVINNFETYIKKANVRLIEDSPYKDIAFQESVFFAQRNRNLSLVDSIIRQIVVDISVKVDYLVTFNKRDFIDVCLRRKIEIYE
ncbi:MAG TPA: hypothetical protein PK325_09875 [Cyclobacteriaceae bacterium]|nr:hypothetical protein [Cyclobacteriaceae bacterium]HMV09535.1 hypothetical protein [Cyclobacteriaceae bacterium]HMX02002.1 hypothetical protein [Cyclobacteriaceae bacterium]HMX51871.1 hypothetical protein [Cyclobacteriaceae bacterium]HMY94825.1 hypothetical protein [Cyclobacteriaceae bacterium]